MLIPSFSRSRSSLGASLSRRVNANSQLRSHIGIANDKLIKKGEC